MHTHQPIRGEISGDEYQREKLLGSKVARVPQEKMARVPHNFHDAILECILHPQIEPDRLYDPPDMQLNTIHFFLADELGLDDHSNLKFFPSIHCSADEHGVDFFIVYTDPDTGNEVMVTVDLSIDPSKFGEQDFSADILFRPTDVRVRGSAYPGGLRVDMPDIENQSAKEESDSEEQANEEIAKMIAKLIRHKIDAGDHQNYAVYSKRARLTDKVRAALQDLLGPKLTQHPAHPQATPHHIRVGEPARGRGHNPRYNKLVQ